MPVECILLRPDRTVRLQTQTSPPNPPHHTNPYRTHKHTNPRTPVAARSAPPPPAPPTPPHPKTMHVTAHAAAHRLLRLHLLLLLPRFRSARRQRYGDPCRTATTAAAGVRRPPQSRGGCCRRHCPRCWPAWGRNKTAGHGTRALPRWRRTQPLCELTCFKTCVVSPG